MKKFNQGPSVHIGWKGVALNVKESSNFKPWGDPKRAVNSTLTFIEDKTNAHEVMTCPRLHNLPEWEWESPTVSLLSLLTHYFISIQFNANVLPRSEVIHYSSLLHYQGLVAQTDQAGCDEEIWCLGSFERRQQGPLLRNISCLVSTGLKPWLQHVLLCDTGQAI